ncbi:hypothetical protein F2Q70_00021014 [Brassica cretica]|uniref:Uncharacterized protein n=2 Tax=Brassica cretica TaxID=69181 RepID=A0A3N6PSS9_BRACR|nr:hypothetical protein F2Q70_00021014 [Brassica cretica]KAF2558688.1 hypothetical protein F2Q68_00014489 [Brassica cretica]KAF3609398.1 hypothetical protein DY000_02046988 [Brassica cretica]
MTRCGTLDETELPIMDSVPARFYVDSSEAFWEKINSDQEKEKQTSGSGESEMVNDGRSARSSGGVFSLLVSGSGEALKDDACLLHVLLMQLSLIFSFGLILG